MLRYLCILLVLLALPFLNGCGGLHSGGCGGASYGSANSFYAGAYAGTYTKGGMPGSAENLVLNIAIDSSGEVSGTITEPTSQRTTTVTGEIGDWHDACAVDTTNLEIDFTFTGETQARKLVAVRFFEEEQPLVFSIAYLHMSAQIGDGELELVKL